jgi:hypothetical protein
MNAVIKIKGLPQAIHRMSAQEFAVWEIDEPERHEFFRGEGFKVFGMVYRRQANPANWLLTQGLTEIGLELRLRISLRE